MARVRSLVRLKRLLDEWRARGETARALGLTGQNQGIPSVAGARALVIDEWELNGDVILRALAREGIEAEPVRTGAEVIERAGAAFLRPDRDQPAARRRGFAEAGVGSARGRLDA